MTLDEFARRLGRRTPALNSTQLALSLLWWRERNATHPDDRTASAGDLARELQRLGLGAPNSSRLGKSLASSRLTLRTSKNFRLKTDAAPKIEAMLAGVLEPTAPEVPASGEFLPEDVWRGTRGYIEVVCEQLNGCYFATYYDAASVMVRRLVETLLIEAYEKLGREAEIKRDGTLFMLGDIVERAVSTSGLSTLSRDSKKALKSVKELGDSSAHNRRFIARKHDLDDLRSPLRRLVDDLIALADLRRARPK
ncbi:hypothetical protein [Anaeromyxobacter dehalogenans]|uniref:DUF4145 domain-containing protein n=1 Tax=Anaeromyxobacter dehalogenans (strain 2CP-C) TaxID=290397 RepID=Q2IIY5_ANADE|nr:hypothetical protein [Anaeromyxobacter dehalogenans]ABC81618.1 hypothetical protein Adeh_1846 [Anaeromyxobacter dehalogenans 2CP-C]